MVKILYNISGIVSMSFTVGEVAYKKSLVGKSVILGLKLKNYILYSIWRFSRRHQIV